MRQFIRPVKSKKISDSFDDHVERGSVNPGTDYIVPVGTPVVAVEAGVIRTVVTSVAGAGGRLVLLDMGTWSADYLHLSKVLVKKGQKVKKGDLIGLSGGSGNGKELGYGPHLHFSIRKGSEWLTESGNRDFEEILTIQRDRRKAASTKTGTES